MQRITKVLLQVVLFSVLFSGIQTAVAQDIKVACVGNSITIGGGTITFPYQLDVLLGEGWDVANFGVSGTTMLRSGDYPYWDQQAFTDVMNYQPDKVIIKLGTNDSKYFNWNYESEFYTDYLAMVDTFAGLDSHPEIYICTPAKAYSGGYSIDDSVITYGIIPLIDSVSHNRDVESIDLHTLTDNRSYYFPDGIHPNSGGNNYIACILFNVLVDSNMLVVSDTNALLNRPVTSGNANDNTQSNLTDGDFAYEWNSEGLPASATIDMGTENLIDNFQLLLSPDKNKGYQYTIEGSSNSTDWSMLVDQSGRMDTVTSYSVDTINPTSMRYVRLTVTSFSNSSDNIINIMEFKALKSAGYEHAPFVGINRVSANAHTLYVLPQYSGDALAYYEKTSDLGYYFMHDFTINTSTRVGMYRTGILGKTYMYYTVNFYDGIQVNSDVSLYTYYDPNPDAVSVEMKADEIIIYPNPSTGEIAFTNLPEGHGTSSIKIFNTNGKLIRILNPGAGVLTLNWDGQDLNSNEVSAGMYICIIENGQKISHRKLIILQE